MKKQRVIKFKACLPLLLSQQTKRLKISMAQWRALPESERDKSRKYSAGRYLGWDYYRVMKLEPFPNPYLERLRARLAARKVKCTEIEHFVDDVVFVTINSF